MVRVAINGFGRIGRQVLQAGIGDPAIEWVAINDLSKVEDLAYLLKYDSVYGTFPGTVDVKDNALVINGKTVQVFSEKNPAALPWNTLDIDVVLECTGFFTAREGAALHLDAGAKKVLISAPGKNPDFSIVRGVNEHEYDNKKHHIVSNCSCTTNASAPLCKVLHDNFTIKRGMLVTAHAYTASQRLIDGPSKKDPRRGRHAAINIIPTSTGAAKSVVEVMPELKDKLDAFAWRVPVPVGSIVSLICEVKKEVTEEKINWLFEQVSQHHMKGILAYAKDPLVLQDIVKDPHSVIFDSHSTKIVDNTFVNISGWYDNEWGFSHRMVEVLKFL
ncbi:type I glyceraldehyde-3-phosphate dehydrogenase [Candidatus Woesearchaeota archaeon]|nr:type I glyceraldehyde-3-phosphate dehydrogenase [Candidatus Woesearchaeota archaeon]